MEVVIRIIESGLIFVAVIALLVLVHEFGHFIVAKLAGMRIDEFGLGFPPRALTIAKRGETEYTLNWLPFGGFVRIYGENGTDVQDASHGGRAFTDKPRYLQALVLVAGVLMNVLLAYALLVGALWAGVPRSLSPEQMARATGVSLSVLGIVPDSPASQAGLATSDLIVSAADVHGSWQAANAGDLSAFVAQSGGDTILLTTRRGSIQKSYAIVPVQGLVPDDPGRYAIGVQVSGPVGIVPVSLGTALVQGVSFTWQLTEATVQGLGHLVVHPSLSQVQGPVGIAADTLPVLSVGFGNLITFISAISITLAIVNLIPLPALDGGRLVVVLFEGLSRRRVNPALLERVTAASFVFLLLLMVVVTAHDVFRLVH